MGQLQLQSKERIYYGFKFNGVNQVVNYAIVMTDYLSVNIASFDI